MTDATLRPAVWIGLDSMHPVRDGLALEELEVAEPRRRGRRRGSKNIVRRDASGPGKGPIRRLSLIRKAHRTLRACQRALSDPRYLTHTVEVCKQVAKDFGLRERELYSAFMRWDDRQYRRELAQSGGGAMTRSACFGCAASPDGPGRLRRACWSFDPTDWECASGAICAKRDDCDGTEDCPECNGTGFVSIDLAEARYYLRGAA